jgi:hypothetical protein
MLVVDSTLPDTRARRPFARRKLSHLLLVPLETINQQAILSEAHRYGLLLISFRRRHRGRDAARDEKLMVLLPGSRAHHCSIDAGPAHDLHAGCTCLHITSWFVYAGQHAVGSMETQTETTACASFQPVNGFPVEHLPFPLPFSWRPIPDSRYLQPAAIRVDRF